MVNGYVSKKQPSLLGSAVAFLMLIFPGGLHDTDYGYNNTDNRNDNTSYTDYGFHILCSFPLIFHLCITSEILEVLK
ncbi:MAG: hypothetical protein KH452_13590, partial [Clostridiales bacterium]|nr:hypothetical protein [Clostridiales bacterium]